MHDLDAETRVTVSSGPSKATTAEEGPTSKKRSLAGQDSRRIWHNWRALFAPGAES